MKSVREKLLVKRLVAQIDYSTRVEWFTTYPAIFQSYLDDAERFSRWAHGPQHFDVIAPREHRQLTAGPKQASASAENIDPSTTSDELDSFARFFEGVLSHLSPRKLDRVGVRAFFLLPAPSFTRLVSALSADLAGSLKDTAVHQAGPSDLMVLWVFNDEKSKETSSWQLGPVRREEFDKWFVSQDSAPEVDQRYLPKAALMGNVDCARGDVAADPKALAEALIQNYMKAHQGFVELASVLAQEL